MRLLAARARAGALALRAAKIAVVSAAVPGLLLTWSAGVAAAAPARAVTGSAAGAERFHLTTSDSSSDRQHVQAAGVLTATGYALAGDFAASRGVSVLVFRVGRIHLVTHATYASASVPNPASCRFTEVFKGSYAIHGSAGRYRRATGSGGYTTRIYGKLKKTSSGGCGSRLASFWQSTRTQGSLQL
jgi:hypothetical protein